MLTRLFGWHSLIWRTGHGRPIAATILVIFALFLSFPDITLSPFKLAQITMFGKYQNMVPRQPQSESVVIVEIDEATLNVIGQWPWPRNYFGALIDAIAALKPAAIGLDIIMPEPDHASPQAVAESRPDLSEDVRNALNGVASNDRLLAASLANAPIILGAAGFPFKTSETLEGLRTSPIEVRGIDPLPLLNAYPYVLASMPELQAAAHGQALLSSNPDNGVVRRAAVLSNLNGAITPGLSLEMIRLAHAAPNMVVEADSHGVEAVVIGSKRIPLQSNGEAWVHYDKASRQRCISALSLLKGEVPPERIAGKMVLVGLTGIGLLDMITTSLGDRRPGVEVHAQLIESFEDGHFVTRPWWTKWLEVGILIFGGLVLIWHIPESKLRLTAWRGGAAPADTDQEHPKPIQSKAKPDHKKVEKPKLKVFLRVFLNVLLIGTGIALFRWCDLLFDSTSLFMSLNAVLGSLTASNSIVSKIKQKNKEHTLQEHHLQEAKIAGELEAAHRIQLGSLPVASNLFSGESRFEIDAMLKPSLQVGGDIYNFFMLDERRLFFVIGGTSCKGLPASVFMAITKTVAKNAALRESDDISTIVNMTNREMSRENPNMLSVTAVLGILNVESGALEFVNASQEAPWRISANGSIERLNGDSGSALCVSGDIAYPAQRVQLALGDTLVMLTGGIAKAANADTEPYGIERFSAALKNAARAPHTSTLIATLHYDIHTFVGDTVPSEDLTLLALRWRGGNDQSKP